MALVIRYKCPSCAAPREGSGGSAWVRCTYCRTLIAFDWQTWFESPAYAAYLKQAAASVSSWSTYSATIAEADAAVKAGKPDRAEAALTKACEQMLGLLPHTAPPEVQTDPGYRAAHLRYSAAFMLAQRVDPELKRLDAELQAQARKIDFKAPLPALKVVAGLLAQQAIRCGKLELPPDPDSLSPEQRGRLWQVQYLSAWLHLVPPEQRITLLELVWGKGSVVQQGEAASEEGGMFTDWKCPACGLCSLQMNAAPERTCLGCFFRQQATVELPALEVACRACAALVTVPQGAAEAACASCGSLVQRSARTFGAERDLIKDAMGKHAPAAAGAGGIPGMPVDDSNREGFQLAGLVRVATGYAALVNGPRFANLVRKTWPEASDKERANQIAAALKLGKADGSATPDGAKLLEDARRLLGA